MDVIIDQSIPAAPNPPPPSPWLLWSICPPCQSWGWDICKFCVLPRGRALANPGANPKLLTHTVSYQHNYNYTVDFNGKTSRLAHLSRTEKNWRGLEMYVLDFMHAFLHCLSSQNYIAKWGSIDKNQCFFGYWIQFLLILFEEHPFVFIKLFQTVNFTVHY